MKLTLTTFIILGIILVMAMITGCPKPQTEPAKSPEQTDSTHTDEGMNGDVHPEVNRMFEIVDDDVIDGIQVINIVCSPSIESYTSEELETEVMRMVETHPDSPSIRVNYYDEGQTPGSVEPTVVYGWSREGGLVNYSEQQE